MDPKYLQVEKNLATAHRALSHVVWLTEADANPGFCEDVRLLSYEVAKLLEDSIRTGRALRTRPSSRG